MQKIFILFIVTLTCVIAYASYGAVNTDTHTYILNEQEGTLLAIDRYTMLETSIKVGPNPQSFLVHGNLGYVTNLGNGTVSVIDLDTQKVTKTISVGDRHKAAPSDMVISGDFGFVSNCGLNQVVAIDLKSKKIVKTIPVEMGPKSIVAHNGFLYVLNSSSDSISIIDPQTQQVTETLALGKDIFAINMALQNDNLYIKDLGSSLYVFDLVSRKIIKKFYFDQPIRKVVVERHLGYVLKKKSKTISVIDLDTLAERTPIQLQDVPFSFVIQAGRGYVNYAKRNDISLIDLFSKSVIATVDTGFRLKDNFLDASRTHLYVGTTRVRPLYPNPFSFSWDVDHDRLFDYVSMDPRIFTMPAKPVDKDDYLKVVTQSDPYLELFEALWEGNRDKAQVMVQYLAQKKDPVITKLISRARSLCCSVRPVPSTTSTTTSTSSSTAIATPPVVIHKPIVVAIKSEDAKEKKKAKKAKAKKAKKAAKKAKAKKTKAVVAVSSSSSTKIDVKKDVDIKKKSKEKKSKDKKAPLSKPSKAI